MQDITVGNIQIGQHQPLAVIAGPCLAESEQLCLQIAQALRDRCAELGLGFIFKASFDKANRSAISSRRGPGMIRGLAMLEAVKAELGVPVTTDIHEPGHAAPAARTVDLLQIPAFLCRQTDLLIAAAATGKPVNVKKGQFMSPGEMVNVVQKLRHSQPEMRGNKAVAGGIMLTERGTFFGYQRLVNDFVGLGDLMDLGCPVCFDTTHSTQQPGGGEGGKTSGGRPDRSPLLARAAVAAGVQAVFIETHPDPGNALSDASTMLPLSQALSLLGTLASVHQALGG